MNPYSMTDLLKAHGLLMHGLTHEAGAFRNSGVGIFADEHLVHMAPPSEFVPKHMKELMDWVTHAQDVHPLVRSSVFHYEFEIIHPFADGNGRMGRMWQTLLLYRWKTVLGWLPMETVIKERQEEYYRVLGEADRRADSGVFIEFILQAIYDSIQEMTKTEQVREQVPEQVGRLMEAIGDNSLSTKELMEKLGLRHRPSFRDNYLLPALALGLLEMTLPDKPNSSKQKYRRVHARTSI